MSEAPVKLLLVGATGMVGRAILARSVGRSDVAVTGIARREVPRPAGARIEMLIADPADWGRAIAAAAPDVLVSALGTTIRAVGGDKAKFRGVDHDLVLACASAAKAAGVRHMIAVSSVGAASGSRNFYLSVKGETEDGLAKLHFERLDLLRPGLLRGTREGPLRPAERIGMVASPAVDLLLHGGMTRYRSIRAETVADAVLGLVHERRAGRFVHEYEGLVRAARGKNR